MLRRNKAQFREVAVSMWPTFIVAGLISGFAVASGRQAIVWLAAAAVVSVAGATITGEVATVPLILVNLMVGLVFGSLARLYVRLARRMWNAH